MFFQDGGKFCTFYTIHACQGVLRNFALFTPYMHARESYEILLFLHHTYMLGCPTKFRTFYTIHACQGVLRNFALFTPYMLGCPTKFCTFYTILACQGVLRNFALFTPYQHARVSYEISSLLKREVQKQLFKNIF